MTEKGHNNPTTNVPTAAAGAPPPEGPWRRNMRRAFKVAVIITVVERLREGWDFVRTKLWPALRAWWERFVAIWNTIDDFAFGGLL